MAVSAFRIKALCCAHTKAAKTRFSSRPFGQIEGTQLNFPNGPRSPKRWEQLKERGNKRPPALFYRNLCQYPRIRPGRPGLRSFVKGGRKEENLLLLCRLFFVWCGNGSNRNCSPRSCPRSFTEGLSLPRCFEMPPLPTPGLQRLASVPRLAALFRSPTCPSVCQCRAPVSTVEASGEVPASARTNPSSVCRFRCFGSYSFQAYFLVTFRINPSHSSRRQRCPIEGYRGSLNFPL